MADKITDINAILNEFRDVEVETLTDVLATAGKEAVGELHSSSPKRTGKYAKGWKVKKVTKKNGVIEVTVYNKDHYQLTHLLEYGHAKWIGGRDTGEKVEGKPHIEKAEQNAIQQVESELKIKL